MGSAGETTLRSHRVMGRRWATQLEQRRKEGRGSLTRASAWQLAMSRETSVAWGLLAAGSMACEGEQCMAETVTSSTHLGHALVQVLHETSGLRYRALQLPPSHSVVGAVAPS